MTTEEYKEQLTNYKIDQGNHSEALSPLIEAAAALCCTVEMTRREISALASTTMEGSHGGEQPHPVFKTQRDAIETLLRVMKALGMTADTITTGSTDDRMTELYRTVSDSLADAAK